MKYLSVIYYDTFARFFCAIEDAVRKRDPEAEFLHLAIFPSGWLYMKAKARNVRLLPWQVRNSDASAVIHDPAILDRVALYHAVTGERYGADYRVKLRERAARYIDVANRVLTEFKPDTVIFSGDTRIACEAFAYALDTSNTSARRFFFEQGPNGTTIFDTRGVNANCSFREHTGNLNGEDFPATASARPKQYRRNPIFRGMDHALSHALRLAGRLPPEWDSMSLHKANKATYRAGFQSVADQGQRRTHEILVALQVPDDANNIHHNPLNLGDAELVRWVLQATPGDHATIRIREHPLYRRRYSDALYELAAHEPRVFLSSASLGEDLACADVVVTVNSMTGLDAYLKGVPVVVLGNAFYDHLQGMVRAHDVETLAAAISHLREVSMAELLEGRDPAAIFTQLREQNFIPGHYRDRKLTAPEAIARILVPGA